MSLMRFLSAGKSLVGGKNNNGRYEVTAKGLLPKFVSAKNPFGPKPGSASVPAGEGEVTPALQPLPARSEQASEKSAAPEKKETTPARTPALAGKSGGVWGRFWSGFGRITGAVVPKRKARSEVRFVAPAVRQPIQGELSLDTVKVMRNDLSDTDFEVVPARRASAAADVSPKAAAVGRSEPAALDAVMKS